MIYRVEDLFLRIRNGMNIKQEMGAGGLPITRIETIANAEINLERVGYAGLTMDQVRNYLLEDSEILFSHINSVAHIGKCALYSKDMGELVHGMNLLSFKPNQTVVFPKYALYALRSRAFKDQLVKSIKKAVNQASVSISDIKNITLNVPPLAEQKRIAAILDKAGEIKAKREQAIFKLDELRKCVFNDLLQKNQDSLTTVKLGTVCNFVRGPFGGALKKEIFKNDGYAVYEQQHAIYDQFTDVRYYVDRAKFEEMKRFELRAGDLIMSCSGTMGKVAIVPEGIREGIINQALLKLTPTNKLNVRYLKEYMEGSLFQASLENETHGAAIKNVASVAVLKELPIALPTIDVQNEIVNIINNIFELVKLNNQHLEKDAALISSLQHQAFTTGFAV